MRLTSRTFKLYSLRYDTRPTSNVTTKAIDRAARSVGIVHHIRELLINETDVYQESGRHTRPSLKKECLQMIKELEEYKVFEEHGRKPSAYRQVKNVLQHCSTKQLKAWI